VDISNIGAVVATFIARAIADEVLPFSYIATCFNHLKDCATESVSQLVMVRISLYKIPFRFKALLWESIIIVPPHPTCKAYPIAILLHDHCVIYALLPTPLLYAVNHTLLVMAISCKGKGEQHMEATNEIVNIKQYNKAPE